MRTVVITGASGGVAQEMVKLLPNDQLILVGRSLEKFTKLYSNHAYCELVELDITDYKALETFTEEIYSQYGQIDVLVNNAGYGIFEKTPIKSLIGAVFAGIFFPVCDCAIVPVACSILKKGYS